MKYLKRVSEGGSDYYTTDYEFTVPFAHITEKDVRNAPRPFICNEVHPSAGLGVVLNDMARAIVDLPYAPTRERAKRERNIANRNADTAISTRFIQPDQLDHKEVWEMGKSHFLRWNIQPVEVKNLVKYMKHHQFEALVVSVIGRGGEVLSHDFTILDPDGQMGWPWTGYGIFCCWNRELPARKLGRYSIMKVLETLGELGYARYDLGASSTPGWESVMGYKNDFATSREPSIWIVLIDPEHPLVEEYGIDLTRINLLREGEPI